ncbi:MFS transporter [Rhizohabitans arisaemae]|uniref:MFS transporter n=1 Tax=Rhizohabitans arisaemae TaxID=2720610 RepID=UPI0024B0B622|nr:MFS transporter [Rhizohabitans arisaemae]
MFRSLEHRRFRVFAGGFATATTATWMHRVAQDWLILQLTGSGVALGVITALQFTPMLLLSPWGGVIADRYPRRALLIGTQTAMGVLATALGLVVIAGVAEPWHVYLIALLFGGATAVDQPARQAYVGDIVPPELLQNAVGLTGALFNLGRVIGPAVSGLGIAAAGSTAPVLLATALLYAMVAILWRVAGDDGLEKRVKPTSKARLPDGFLYIRRNPDLLLVVILVGFVATFGLNFQLTTALMATGTFRLGADAYGLLSSVLACGALTGALLAARRGAPGPRRVVFAGVVFGLLELAAGLMPDYPTFMISLFPVGVAMLTFATTASTTVQLTSDPAMRGRVMGIYLLVVFGANPLGGPVIGWMAEAFGARWTLIGGGAVSALAALVAGLVLRCRSRAAGAVTEPLPQGTDTASGDR